MPTAFELSVWDEIDKIPYGQTRSYKDIAIITGLSENHIAVKMKRIRKKLFECIKPKIN